MLDDKTFTCIVDVTPLVSVDLVVVRREKEVLLGMRNNRPAQGFWFVPGGRIFKNETIRSALIRVSEKELGLGTALITGELDPGFLGTFEHFYNDCFAGDIGVSTHYVVLGHILKVPDGMVISAGDEQHAELRWWPIAEALESPHVHQFSKDYFLRGYK